MARATRSTRSRYTLVLLLLTGITLLTLDYRGFKPLDAIQSGVLGIFAPVGDVGSSGFRPVGDAWNGAFSFGDLRNENEDLRRQLDEARGRLTDADAAKHELEKLQKQLDLPFLGEIPAVRARVTSGSITNFDTTVQLDKGTSSGIDRGMPVVAGGGLVGTVIEVSGERSVVRLISDRSFQVGVRVAGAPGLGIVAGQGDEFRMRAREFDVTTPLKDGDILVTSGAARSTLPPDIPIGKVSSITTNQTALQKEADVQLLANLNDLTYVTVVLYRPKSD